MELKGTPPRGLLVAAKRAKHYFDLEYKPILIPNRDGEIKYPASKTYEQLLGPEHRLLEKSYERKTKENQTLKWKKSTILDYSLLIICVSS